MKLCFDSIQEVKDFVGSLKGVRGGKKDDGTDTDTSTAALNTAGNTGNAPPPLMPPQGGPGGPAFTPQQQTAFAPPAGGFPGVGAAPQLDPAVQGLVKRICDRVDVIIAQGQTPPGDMLKWFQNQCGPEAANATLDQIKTVFLPKASQPTLDSMAKLVGA